MTNSQSADSTEDVHVFDNGWVFANAQEDDPYVQRLRDAGGNHRHYCSHFGFFLTLNNSIICQPLCSAIIIGKTNSKLLTVLLFSFANVYSRILSLKHWDTIHNSSRTWARMPLIQHYTRHNSKSF